MQSIQSYRLKKKSYKKVMWLCGSVLNQQKFAALPPPPKKKKKKNFLLHNLE